MLWIFASQNGTFLGNHYDIEWSIFEIWTCKLIKYSSVEIAINAGFSHLPRKDNAETRVCKSILCHIRDEGIRKERLFLFQNLSYVDLRKAKQLRKHALRFWAEFLARTRISNHAGSSSSNNVELGFSVREFVAIWIADSEDVSSLAAASSNHLRTSLCSHACKESV